MCPSPGQLGGPCGLCGRFPDTCVSWPGRQEQTHSIGSSASKGPPASRHVGRRDTGYARGTLTCEERDRPHGHVTTPPDTLRLDLEAELASQCAGASTAGPPDPCRQPACGGTRCPPVMLKGVWHLLPHAHRTDEWVRLPLCQHDTETVLVELQALLVLAEESPFCGAKGSCSALPASHPRPVPQPSLTHNRQGARQDATTGTNVHCSTRLCLAGSHPSRLSRVCTSMTRGPRGIGLGGSLESSDPAWARRAEFKTICSPTITRPVCAVHNPCSLAVFARVASTQPHQDAAGRRGSSARNGSLRYRSTQYLHGCAGQPQPAGHTIHQSSKSHPAGTQPCP